MHVNVDDYTRYFLNHIVESLKSEYAGAPGRTGLDELTRGLVSLPGPEFATTVERLAEYVDAPREVLNGKVNALVDKLLAQPVLAGFDADFLRVLLYARCGDAKTLSRVYQYLRCEDMNGHDRSMIGGAIPRTASDAPREMIRKLAQVAFVTRGGALVLMLDQLELSGVDSAQALVAFQHAVDALLSIASEVGSVIVVIACLSNLYDKALKVLGLATVDRLEKEPALERLESNLSFENIKAIVGMRLAWMFARAGAAYLASDPLYPIPESGLRQLVNWRPRDVLDWCQKFRERCIAADRIVELPPLQSPPPLPPLPPPPRDPERSVMERIEAAWLEACERIRVPTLEDHDVLALVSVAARAFALENTLPLTISPRKDSWLRLQLALEAEHVEVVIGVTNHAPQGGGFSSQLDDLRAAARGSAAALIAVRTKPFPTGASSQKAVAAFTKGKGRTSLLDKDVLRALRAYQAFQPEFPADEVAEWMRTRRPISRLAPIAEMFDVDPFRALVRPAVSSSAPNEESAPGPVPTERRSAKGRPRGSARQDEGRV
jgi:hypothetical protein